MDSLGQRETPVSRTSSEPDPPRSAEPTLLAAAPGARAGPRPHVLAVTCTPVSSRPSSSESLSAKTCSLFLPNYVQDKYLLQLLRSADDVSTWVAAEIVTSHTSKVGAPETGVWPQGRGAPRGAPLVRSPGAAGPQAPPEARVKAVSRLPSTATPHTPPGSPDGHGLSHCVPTRLFGLLHTRTGSESHGGPSCGPLPHLQCHTCTGTDTGSLTQMPSLTHLPPHALPHTHIHTHIPSHVHTHTLTHSYLRAHSLSYSLTHTISHTHTLKHHTHTPSHTRIHSLTHTSHICTLRLTLLHTLTYPQALTLPLTFTLPYIHSTHTLLTHSPHIYPPHSHSLIYTLSTYPLSHTSSHTHTPPPSPLTLPHTSHIDTLPPHTPYTHTSHTFPHTHTPSRTYPLRHTASHTHTPSHIPSHTLLLSHT